MRVLLGPHDHAIVVVPNYQSSETIPVAMGSVSGVALDPQDDWQLDVDALRKSVRPNTKLVSVNFPNNPTGAIPSRSTFDAIVDICREHDLYLFSDEVYRMLEIDVSKRLPQVADVYDKGLSLNVMSKAYGLPGLRIGWIAGKDVALLRRLERYKHYLSICNSGPSERLALIALKVRERIFTLHRARISKNLDALDAFFAEYPELFEWRRPDGGCVAFPRFLGAEGVETFCERIVEQEGVLLLPASLYRSEVAAHPTDRFRIGCGRSHIDAGLNAFRRFLVKRTS